MWTLVKFGRAQKKNLVRAMGDEAAAGLFDGWFKKAQPLPAGRSGVGSTDGLSDRELLESLHATQRLQQQTRLRTCE